MAIYEFYEVTNNYFMIKFDEMILASTLVNANFTLTRTGATPATVTNPFLAIDLTKDYQSISRTLYLWWNFTLQGGAEYNLTIQNLKNVLGTTLTTDVITFDVDPPGATPSDPESTNRPSRDPVDVEDYSIKLVGTLLDDTTDSVADTATRLEVVSIKPNLAQSYYLSDDDYGGRIIVTFNTVPAANFITSQDFRLEKKLVGSGFAVWQAVNTVIAADASEPTVTIYLPSTDATPIYSYAKDDSTEHVFWEEGYKYRLTINSDISS